MSRPVPRAGVVDVRTQIVEDEGRRLVVYKDSLGIPTVGVGHRVEPKDGLSIGDAINGARCDALFERDLVDAESDLDCWLPWWRHMSPARQAVLHGMCFNMGRKMLQFRKALGYMQVCAWENAAAELRDSKAFHQEPARIERWAYQLTDDRFF